MGVVGVLFYEFFFINKMTIEMQHEMLLWALLIEEFLAKKRQYIFLCNEKIGVLLLTIFLHYSESYLNHLELELIRVVGSWVTDINSSFSSVGFLILSEVSAVNRVFISSKYISSLKGSSGI